MENHPVKPDTPVVLPPRAFAQAAKRPAPHRRAKRPEEISANLRKVVRFLAVLCLLLSLALAAAVFLLVREYRRPEPSVPDPGQNYNTGLTDSTKSTAPTQTTDPTAVTEPSGSSDPTGSTAATDPST